MTLADVVWVIDTSSIIEVRRSVPMAVRRATFAALTQLVNESRLVYPPEVLAELERNIDPKSPDEQYLWAKANAHAAHVRARCSLDDVRSVLFQVPDVIDHEKDSGVEEADGYVLAVAMKLCSDGVDARVVTKEKVDTPSRMCQ
jgi:hypothetical protein